MEAINDPFEKKNLRTQLDEIETNRKTLFAPVSIKELCLHNSQLIHLFCIK